MPGSAAARTCVWSVTRSRRSTRSPAPPPPTCSASGGGSPTPPRSASCATTGPRRRSSPWRTACSPPYRTSVLAVRGWTAEPPASSGAVRERWESLAALHRLAQDLSDMTLTEFVAELEERQASQHAPAAAGVTLASLHAAKGLEWDAVFLVG